MVAQGENGVVPAHFDVADWQLRERNAAEQSVGGVLVREEVVAAESILLTFLL